MPSVLVSFALNQTIFTLNQTRKEEYIMKNEALSNLNINVTKIVKYVCLAGVLIVGIIFFEKGFTAFIKSRQADKNEK